MEGEESDKSDLMLSSASSSNVSPLSSSISSSISSASSRSFPNLIDPHHVAVLRTAAGDLFRRSVGGDALAAQYCFLQTLSRVTHRADDHGLGCVVLNLTHCHPSPFPSPQPSSHPLALSLQAAFTQLTPLCHLLPLNLAYVNDVSTPHWQSSRSLRWERTRFSPLQLPLGCLLVMDETAMTTGRLTAKGAASLRTAKTLLDTQVLKYDFSYGKQGGVEDGRDRDGMTDGMADGMTDGIDPTQELSVPVDVTPVILSVERSILRDDAHVVLPWNPTSAIPSPEDLMTHPTSCSKDHYQLWPRIRAYLATVRELPYIIPKDMEAVLEQYFVRQRQESAAARSEFTPERFATLLSLARLHTLSFGESELTKKRWAEVLDLEHQRLARLRATK